MQGENNEYNNILILSLLSQILKKNFSKESFEYTAYDRHEMYANGEVAELLTQYPVMSDYQNVSLY